MMSTDLTRAGILEGQDSVVSGAEKLLRDKSHNVEAGPRNLKSFRRVAGAVVGALRFETVASPTAREGSKRAIQQSPSSPAGEQGPPRDKDGGRADQVCLRGCRRWFRLS